MSGQMTLAARPIIIRKNGTGPDKDIVLDGNPVPKENTAFDRHAIADAYPALDERVVAKIAFLANDRTGQDMHESRQPRSLANQDTVIHERLGMTEILALGMNCAGGVAVGS